LTCQSGTRGNCWKHITYLLKERNSNGDDRSSPQLWFEKIDPSPDLKHDWTSIRMLSSFHLILKFDLSNNTFPLGLDPIVILW
jgi:hypothetical protein